MNEKRAEWVRKKAELIRTVEWLGFPPDLGEAAASVLGSPKAMDRLIRYLHYVKPKKMETVADEILAIRSEIDAWKDKKASEEANMKINEMIWRGFDDDGPEDGE